MRLINQTIIKILNKHTSWKARVYGDEPREKLFFEHRNLDILGFKDNKSILKDLEKISISVICSRWEEPFGRTSLEASANGCAVIISNRGGLSETVTDSIILENLSSKNLYKDKLLCIKKALITQTNNYEFKQ